MGWSLSPESSSSQESPVILKIMNYQVIEDYEKLSSEYDKILEISGKIFLALKENKKQDLVLSLIQEKSEAADRIRKLSTIISESAIPSSLKRSDFLLSIKEKIKNIENKAFLLLELENKIKEHLEV
jgi:hypothetical protein